MQGKRARKRIDFKSIGVSALRNVDHVIHWLLPAGERKGDEWVALNPRRSDNGLGSFKVNTRTGRWADFAAGAVGGDLISLVAYVRNVRQCHAALMLEKFLGAGCE